VIVQTIDGIGFLYRITGDYAEVLGDERVGLIDNAMHHAFKANLQNSYMVALSGALRLAPGLRPEVLIDANGRLV